MPAIKMTKKEQELLDIFDRFIHEWSLLGKEPPPRELIITREQGKLFESICGKIGQGMRTGTINVKNKAYKKIPVVHL